MKKIVSVLLVSAMLAATLTACDNNSSNDSSDNGSVSDNSSSSNTDSSADNASSDGNSTEDSESASESNPDDNIVIPDDPDNPSGEEEGADNSGLEYPDNKAGQMVKAALAINVWPGMAIVEDQTMVDALFYDRGFVVDNYDEYCLTSNFMSGQLNNVLVIKPKAGSEEEVETVFNNYMEALKTDQNLTFYPAQQESAAGAVQGKTDDGYYYLIVHVNGADIESGMLAAL
ncbi:MAG: hypothetical protein K2N38_03955 [Oscillospiraceae bacterium]|nr:hypothetical protein [Oscillospiraceae bacterium]